MALDPQPVRPHGQTAITYSTAVSRFLAQSGSGFAATAKSFLRSMQMARMMSRLANISDPQLAAIGIARSQIPQYAEKLMAQETDGKNQDRGNVP